MVQGKKKSLWANYSLLVEVETVKTILIDDTTLSTFSVSSIYMNHFCSLHKNILRGVRRVGSQYFHVFHFQSFWVSVQFHLFSKMKLIHVDEYFLSRYCHRMKIARPTATTSQSILKHRLLKLKRCWQQLYAHDRWFFFSLSREIVALESLGEVGSFSELKLRNVPVTPIASFIWATSKNYLKATRTRNGEPSQSSGSNKRPDYRVFSSTTTYWSAIRTANKSTIKPTDSTNRATKWTANWSANKRSDLDTSVKNRL